MDKERRRDHRTKEDFGMICRIYRKIELETDLSKIIDLSLFGLCFICENELSKNDILHLIFRAPPDFKDKIEVFGRVVDTEKTADNKFKGRVAFIDIDEKTKAVISRSKRSSA